MDAAKEAIHNFTNKVGHFTKVEEEVKPVVTSQTVKPHRHEETTKAIDKEVHQHHYHTTVQPVSHQEVLPEKHSHQLRDVERREFVHDNEEITKRRVSAEQSQFEDRSITHEIKHTATAAPTVTGEHVHHHVHETVQPVIHKETIVPEVVHTTVPIQEKHVVEAQHHGMSALPMKTLDEFKGAGGILTGSKKLTHEEYDGPPRQYNDKLATTIEKVLPGSQERAGRSDSGVGVVDTDARDVGRTGGVGQTGRY